VLARSPRNVSALVLLGSARLTAGRHRGAVAPLTEARTLAPLNPDVHFNLGLARLGSGEVAAAEAAWRRTLELRPRFAEASANLADVLLRTGRAEAASSVLDEASRHDVESPLLDFLAGKLAVQRGDAGAARRSLERALARGLPPDAAREARALLDAQASRGRRDRAPAGPAGVPPGP
jgi:tetratricopeptide (TPR) repeat protein